MALAAEQFLPHLRTLLLMRRTEEAVCDLGDEFPGNFHVYIGQEATGAAIIAHLHPNDPIFTTHRNHAHNVARGVPLDQLFGEILGRVTGPSQGKGGTFHVMSEAHHTVATAIVGGSTILATGAGLAAQVLHDNRIGVAFLGDRTLNEGAVYEAFNLASLWQLPVLYVCEHNNAVPYDPRLSGMNVAELTDVARAFGLEAEAVDATDPFLLYDVAGDAVARVRRERRPVFLETRTPRWAGNAGADPSLSVTGRTDVSMAWSETSSDANAAWHQADPVLNLIRTGITEEIVDQAAVLSLDHEIQEEISRAVSSARSAPFPAAEAAFLHSLADGDLWPR